jgi:carbamoyl-phosphate synthase small subunit
VFHGEAYGAIGESFGEAVFSTAMTGYQETLTDPSYHRQIVVQTAPHIGNTGVNDEDDESARIWVAGYVVRDPARLASNWRTSGDLADRLAAEGVVGICGIDPGAHQAPARARRDAGLCVQCGRRCGGAGGARVVLAGDGRRGPVGRGHHPRAV